jgi:WD40 repeat protein
LQIGTAIPALTNTISDKNVSSLLQLASIWQNPAGIVKYSPDGTLLFYATSEWIKIFDAASLQPVSQLDEFISPGGDTLSLQISTDNQRILLLQQSRVRVIDRSGKLLFESPVDGKAALTPDGQKIALVKSCLKNTDAVLANCETDIFNVDTGDLVYGFPGKDPILSPDGSLVATTQGNYLAFRQVSDGVKLFELTPDNYLFELKFWTFSPDGSQVVIVHGNQIDLISTKTGKSVQNFQEFAERAYLSPNNTYLGIVNGTEFKVIDLSSDSVSKNENLDQPEAVIGIANDGTAVLQPDASSLFPVEAVQNIEKVSPLAENSTFLLETEYGFCKLTTSMNLSCDAKHQFIRGNDGQYYSASLSNRTITLWHGVDDSKEKVFSVDWSAIAPPDVNWVKLLGYSNQKHFLLLQLNIGQNTEQVALLDTQKIAFIQPWNWEKSQLVFFTLSPDGRYAAIRTSGRSPGLPFAVYEGIFDFDKGEFVWSGGNLDSQKIVFARDGNTMLEIQDRQGMSMVYVYDFNKRELISHYLLQDPFETGTFSRCQIQDAALSSNTQTAFYGCKDGSVLVVNLNDGKELARWKVFNEPVSALNLSTDETLLVTANQSGFIKIWGIP